MSIALSQKVKQMEQDIAALQAEMREAMKLFERQLCTLPSDEPRPFMGLENLIARIDALETKRKPGRPPKNG